MKLISCEKLEKSMVELQFSIDAGMVQSMMSYQRQWKNIKTNLNL